MAADAAPPPADPPADPPDDGASLDGLSAEDAREVAEKARREAAKHRRDARAAQQEADRLRTENERHRAERESETERAVREAVEAERVKLTAEFAGERLHNRLRIRAAGKLRDADDAVLHLGGTLDADSDDAAIDAAIGELVKQRDYLAAPNGAPPAPAGGGLVTQGARSTAPGANGRETSPDDWIRNRARGQ